MTAGMNIRPFEPNRDFWDGRRVAVTGATGFVGTHLTSALAALGARVVVLVRDTVPSSPIRDGWWPRHLSAEPCPAQGPRWRSDQEARDPARLVVPRIGPRPVQPCTLALWDAAKRSVFECR